MAGTGPAPKDPSKRARTNADPIPATKLAFVPGEQPELPVLTDGFWHPMTREWWKVWGDAAQADTFTETDWMVLLETALLHHMFWNGDMKVAGELRLRVAGATPEDRARLRMVFADADEKDMKRGTGSAGPAPASPYGGLRAVPNKTES
jgi:hypothetical protein